MWERQAPLLASVAGILVVIYGCLSSASPRAWDMELDSAFLEHPSFLMVNSQSVGCSGGLQCESLEVVSAFWIQRSGLKASDKTQANFSKKKSYNIE